jgi:A/G-specific adenine glycosylase
MLFPDVSAVAGAPEQQILKAWEGLGYYSRARNIHRAAAVIVREHDGEIPRQRSRLLALPGIGPYTASAIQSIAFNQRCSVVDANVERLFARLLDIDAPLKQAPVKARLHTAVESLLPPGGARMFNQALMEFGALVCTPKNPRCQLCPLVDYCRACHHKTVLNRPVTTSKGKKIEIIMACGIISHGGRYYIQQRMPDDVWGSLWEFPGGRLKDKETPEQAACREITEETEFIVTSLRPFATVVHFYTKYRVTLHGFTCTLQGSSEPVLHAASHYHWLPAAALSEFPFPAGHRRLVEQLCSMTSMQQHEK